jgi:ABC-type polysaccharide/polyol phosphate transport system ATPase subunit
MALIEVDAISKSFRIPSVKRETLREHALDFFRPRPVELLPILQSVSFAVHRGETIGIMGRNGCGKSTLLKIVSGIYRADSGRVVTRAPITPILELGVGWNPDLDAIDNICLLGSVMGLSLKEIRAGTEEILAFAEVERFAHLKLQHYSSGMALRLAYSVAFKAVREILVLDEVFAVGDAGFKARCEARYRELSAAGHTVVIVSHDPLVIRTFCQRALLLERGQVVLDGPAAAVADAYLTLMRGHETEETARPR